MHLIDIMNDNFISKVFNDAWVVQVFISLFFAILFLQSGFDKIWDWKGNLAWLKEHFSKTPFRNNVPALVASLTFFEMLAGLVSLMGAAQVLIFRTFSLAYFGSLFATITLLMLFSGQRLAKDYAGAVSIATYFIIGIVDLYLLA